MGKALSIDNLPIIRDWIKNNRFDATRLEINAQTGHLIARQDGNLKFTIDSKGHLISEVI